MDTKAEIIRLPLTENLHDTYKWMFIFGVCVLFSATGVIFGGAAVGGMFGGFAGLCVYLVMTMISTVDIEGKNVRYEIEFITESCGYAKVDSIRYSPTLPRWLRFDSQDIFITNVTNGVRVRGPYYILKHIMKRITL